MNASPAAPLVDARVLRYLQTLPGWECGSAQPLPPAVADPLRRADRPQALTAVAVGLARLFELADQPNGVVRISVPQ